MVKRGRGRARCRTGRPDDREPGGGFDHQHGLCPRARESGRPISSACPASPRNVKLGTLDGFDTAGGVAIGQRLAENLGLRIGDKIKILIANGAQTPFGVTPRSKVYPVTAIFQIGMAEFDNLFVYMALPEAQAFFNKDNEASVIEIFLRDAGGTRRGQEQNRHGR